MHSLPNIEKAAFCKNDYIGYCNGAQRIRKSGKSWQTCGLASSAGEAVFLSAPTLRELSDKLAAHKAKLAA